MNKFRIKLAALLLCATATVYAAEPSSLLASLAAKEHAVWSALQQKDVAGFKAMLGADCTQIDDTGINSCQDFAASIPDLDFTDVKLADFRVIQLDLNTAVLIYHATAHYAFKGTPMMEDLNMSTLWVKREGDWFAAFHQETPVPKQQ